MQQWPVSRSRLPVPVSCLTLITCWSILDLQQLRLQDAGEAQSRFSFKVPFPLAIVHEQGSLMQPALGLKLVLEGATKKTT